MTNDDQHTPDPPLGGTPPDARTSFRSALRGLLRAASEVAETGVEEARKLAEAARPEVERRARQAKAAAEAARPHIEGKAREATDYVRDHQDDIVRASKRGAEVAASTAAHAVTPRPLRPAIDAMSRELRGSAKPRSADSDAAQHSTAPDAPESAAPETSDSEPTDIPTA